MTENWQTRAEAIERERAKWEARHTLEYAAHWEKKDKLAAVREVLDDDAQSFYEARARILAILDGVREGKK